VEIQLSKGQVAKIDGDFADLALQKWSASYSKNTRTYYAFRRPGSRHNRKRLDLHRLVMERALGRQLRPNEFVDHKNRDTLDCRLENLRVSTNAENCRNQGPRRNNRSGFKGVHWSKQHDKWRASICVNYRVKHLGLFDNPTDAALAYNEAATRFHGSFAYTNAIGF
jgi:hypothetical protein